MFIIFFIFSFVSFCVVIVEGCDGIESGMLVFVCIMKSYLLNVFDRCLCYIGWCYFYVL